MDPVGSASHNEPVQHWSLLSAGALTAVLTREHELRRVGQREAVPGLYVLQRRTAGSRGEPCGEVAVVVQEKDASSLLVRLAPVVSGSGRTSAGCLALWLEPLSEGGVGVVLWVITPKRVRSG